MLNDNYRITRHPIIIGALFCWIGWLILIRMVDIQNLFLDKWYMTVTMIFGSFIAGATSEGGGAVAFPVMTLLFKIDPRIARDFSLCIQAVGMMAASFTIFCLKVPVSTRAILWSGLGGMVGMVVGLELISGVLPPAYTKIFFVSSWLSFAMALFWMNRIKERQVHPLIQNYAGRHALLLVVAGIIGGTISGITGSGLDIVTFAVLVLAFRIDEKIATPTSVILMGMNALWGVLWKGGISKGMAAEAWEYWFVCVPVVVIGAPLGAYFIRNRSRLFVAGFLYISIAVQFIAALLIIPITSNLLLFCGATVLSGILFFRGMSSYGKLRLERLRRN